MEFFKKISRIDFMGRRWYAISVSTTLFILSLILLVVRGLNLGVDFTGGTVIEIGYEHSVDLTVVRTTLSQGGYDDAMVQNFGTTHDVLIRLAPRPGITSAILSEQILGVLRQNATDNKVEVRRVEFVGPQVGGELKEAGGLALLFSTLAILVYVAFRFEYRMAVGAIVAMFHDPVMILGFFSATAIEFDLTVLAALLAIIGYSLNDTVVVFDRIRENFHILRKGTPDEIINRSVNETLSRTLMTSFATLLVVVAMFLWGGRVLHGFSLALLIGIFVGTYSSIFVAAPVALALGLDRQALLPPKKEDEIDRRP
ncbi:Sec translocon accessory complex subunit SecF [Gammaproteobacteria bacterium]